MSSSICKGEVIATYLLESLATAAPKSSKSADYDGA
jgi:hypothetical protein